MTLTFLLRCAFLSLHTNNIKVAGTILRFLAIIYRQRHQLVE